MYRGADKSVDRPGRKQANVSVRMAWISSCALPCRGKKTRLLASRCRWNRARPWHASELVSFLAWLRNYQNPGIHRPFINTHTPHTYIYICVCVVCVCVYIYVCVGCVCVYIYIYIYICVCVCVCIYIYVCVCVVCVCVCVCVWKQLRTENWGGLLLLY